MPDLQSEQLKNTENEKMPESIDFDLAPIDLDQARIQAVVKSRADKLEKIKPHIPLKTYHLILEKLSAERQRFQKFFEFKSKEKVRSELPQSLPKQYFEQRFLKPKVIRID